MECPLGCDLNFTFLSSGEHDIHIPFPYDPDLLTPVSTDPKELLLDHVWEPYVGTEAECTQELWDTLGPFSGTLKVSQLLGRFKVAIPNWVQGIPVLPYKEYLRATSRFGAFIMTHRGSYEGSIPDMLLRGIRVLALQRHVRQEYIDLGVEAFTDVKSLVESALIWKAPSPCRGATPMGEAVSIMDKKFRQILGIAPCQ